MGEYIIKKFIDKQNNIHFNPDLLDVYSYIGDLENIEFESEKISDILNKLFDIITEFEQIYVNFQEEHEIKLSTLNLNEPHRNFPPKKFFKSFTSKKLTESKYTTNLPQILNYFFNSATNIQPRSIQYIEVTSDIRDVLIIPVEEKIENYDYGIILPNFSKRFYVLGSENLSFYSLSSFSTYQRLLGDLLTTLLLKKSKGNIEFAMAMFGLLMAFSTPMSTIIQMLENINTDNVTINGIEDWKSQNYWENIYFKMKVLTQTSSLLNIIIQNLINSCFDFFKNELLYILASLSKLSESPMNFIEDNIMKPVYNAYYFITNNNLPNLKFFKTSEHIKSYYYEGNQVRVINIEVKTGGIPIKKTTNSSEQILFTEELIKNSKNNLIYQRIVVNNNKPVKINVEVEGGNNRIKVNYESDQETEIMENATYLQMAVSNWDDAINISHVLHRRSINYKRFYKKCKYDSNISLDLERTIGDLIKYTGSASIQVDTRTKMLELNYDFISIDY